MLYKSCRCTWGKPSRLRLPAPFLVDDSCEPPPLTLQQTQDEGYLKMKAQAERKARLGGPQRPPPEAKVSGRVCCVNIYSLG